MYSEAWGGLPDKEFLGQLDPALAGLRDRLYANAVSSDHAGRPALPRVGGEAGPAPGIAVAVGAFDAHMGAVGAGIREGTLVKILGTSTCDMMVHPNHQPLADIPGVCGIVDGSILPAYYGIEAGQSRRGRHLPLVRQPPRPGQLWRHGRREIPSDGSGPRRTAARRDAACWRSTGTTATAPSSWIRA